MSWFYPALAGGGLWALGAHGYSLQQQAQQPVENASQNPQVKEPFRGAWQDISKQWGSQQEMRQRFVSVQEDTDVLGSQIFYVDYGDGARTVQYHDPRILQ